MNKDLEIIKKYLHLLYGYYEVDDGKPIQEKVAKAVEQIDAEIERLEKANSGLAETFGALNNEIIYYKHEISRLKAELEKRPEVVYCKDCIWNDGACDEEIKYSAIGEVDLLSFCSAGQRRESEEGK